VPGFVSDNQSKVVCNSISITIREDEKKSFINKNDVLTLLERKNFKYIGIQIDMLNTMSLENYLYQFPAVKKADVYTTVNGILNVVITQRKPVLRIINNSGRSYYIDEDGIIMPGSDRFTAYVLIANGIINDNPLVEKNKSVWNKDSLGNQVPSQILDLYKLSVYINGDDLWRSQIEQIYVNENNEIVLVPRVGSHLILFGKADQIEMKFRKLKSIYKIFNTIGWNRYQTINLKFKNQIICTKK
jgi:cell division protein FtsQ